MSWKKKITLRIHLLSRQGSLCGRWNLFQDDIVFVITNTEFDNGIPVFFREVILIHLFNYFIDGILSSRCC